LAGITGKDVSRFGEQCDCDREQFMQIVHAVIPTGQSLGFVPWAAKQLRRKFIELTSKFSLPTASVRRLKAYAMTPIHHSPPIPRR
jgi:hypothetical protein